MYKYNKELLKNDFGKSAKQYNQSAKLQRIVANKLSDKIKSNIEDSSTESNNRVLLDVGCGTGFIASNLSEKDYAENNNLRIIQSDLSDKMCSVASAYGAVINSDMHLLPFADKTIDIFSSSLAIQWSNNHKQIHSEIDRVLRDKGRFYISTFGSKTLFELKSTFEEIGDNASRINNFENYDDIYIKEFISDKYNVKVTKKQYITEYDNATTLMKEIKNIGANNKTSSRNTIITKNKLIEINEYYKNNFSNENGKVNATWEVVFLIS